MIRYMERMDPETLAELQAFCEGSVFGIKALGPVLSYGLGYDFVSAWEQRNEVGEQTAFLSKYYGAVTVHVSPIGDVQELLAFLRVIGYQALLGPAEVLSEAFPEGETGCVMALSKGSFCTTPSSVNKGLELILSEELRNVYEVLSNGDETFDSVDYGAFLTDFSHRLRHGTARSVLLKENGTPVSTASALVTTENEVYLGAIATVPSARGKHYASTCIQELCHQFENQRVFLLCRPELKTFYERMGFLETDHYLEATSNYE